MPKEWNKSRTKRAYSIKFSPSHIDLDKAIAEYIDSGGKINKFKFIQNSEILKAVNNTYEDTDNFLLDREVFFHNILQLANYIVGV
jgi:hypothetical protein